MLSVLFCIPVEFEWVLPISSKCKSFDHNEDQCPTIIVEKWIPKKVNNEEALNNGNDTTDTADNSDRTTTMAARVPNDHTLNSKATHNMEVPSKDVIYGVSDISKVSADIPPMKANAANNHVKSSVHSGAWTENDYVSIQADKVDFANEVLISNPEETTENSDFQFENQLNDNELLAEMTVSVQQETSSNIDVPVSELPGSNFIHVSVENDNIDSATLNTSQVDINK